MSSRKTAREALTALLDTIATFVQVYDRQVADFSQQSPVAMVYSDGTRPVNLTLLEHYREHAFLIDVWWARDEDTEDRIDDLSKEVYDLLEANEQTVNWTSLVIDEQFSLMDYPVIDGVMYRRETIRVLIW
jgi:hypothetical protein